MSGTKHNPYPICAKCKCGASPQDMQGWEKFKKQDATGLTTEDIWICPSCIDKFQRVKDLLSLKNSQREKELQDCYNEYQPIIDALFTIQKRLKKINDEVFE